jgi:hypothetical protein
VGDGNSPARHGVEHGYQMSLKLWIGRFGEAQQVIRELEAEVVKLRNLFEQVAQYAPPEVLSQILEGGDQRGAQAQGEDGPERAGQPGSDSAGV